MNENCRYINKYGTDCTILKQLYCKKEPDKRCSFYKEREAMQIEESGKREK